MGARLARFTGNATYAEHSERTWDWLTGVDLVDNKTMAVFDGARVDANCTDVNKIQWSVNVALLTEGAAFMYNFVSPYPLSFPATRLAESIVNTTTESDTPARPTAPRSGVTVPKAWPALSWRRSSPKASFTKSPARGRGGAARWTPSS